MHHRFFKIAGLILFSFLPSVSSAQPITFAKVVNIKGGTTPRSVALGDFNRDGKPDVAVANSGNKTVTVLRGNGNGTFTQTASIPFSTTPMFVVAADFDGDGNLDLAVADSNTTGNSTVTILLGNGDGTFAAQPAMSLGLSAFNHSMAVGDFNRDGHLDIAVTNDQSNIVSILLGQGDGTFAPPAPLTLPKINKPLSVAVGDFDGDGILDLVFADGNTVLVAPGLGNGTFNTALDLDQKNSPGFVAVADFDRDGIPDLAITSLSDKNICIRLGNGDDTFASCDGSFKRDVPATAQFILPVDLNGDGILDLVVPLDGSLLSVFQGASDGSLNSGQNLTVKSGSLSAVVADFNGDGRPDILSANFQTGGFSLFSNTTAFTTGGSFGDATDFAITPDQNTSPAHAPSALAVGDFNRDGKLDLVTANSGPNNNISILPGNGDGTFGSASTVAAGTTPAAVAVGDFDRDGILDLAVANSGGSNVSILIGNGNGTFDPALPPTVSVGLTPAGVAIGDFNGDGKLDLAVANKGSDNVSVLLGNGDGTFGAATNFNTGAGPRGIVTADFNRDGFLDLAVADETAGKVVILLGSGNGTFGPKNDFNVGDAPVSIAVGDFDGDGILDLAVANSGTDNVSVLLGKEDGTFAAKTDFSVGNAPSAVVTGDWNGDGILDLAVTNAGDDSVSILFGDGAGGFSSVLAAAFGSPFAVGHAPSALVAGDFNRDGKLDLATANADDDNVSILLNAAPPPVVIAPLAGDVWKIGTTQTIRWSNPGAGSAVNIWLSRDGGMTWKTILKKSPNDGSQTWKVAAPASNGNNAIIRICSTAKGPVCASPSSGTFTIQ